MPIKVCLLFSSLGASKQKLSEFLRTLKTRLFIQQRNMDVRTIVVWKHIMHIYCVLFENVELVYFSPSFFLSQRFGTLVAQTGRILLDRQHARLTRTN